MTREFYFTGKTIDGSEDIFVVNEKRYYLCFEPNNAPAVIDWHPDRWRAFEEYDSEIFFYGDKDMPAEEIAWRIRFYDSFCKGHHLIPPFDLDYLGEMGFAIWLSGQDEDAFKRYKTRHITATQWYWDEVYKRYRAKADELKRLLEN